MWSFIKKLFGIKPKVIFGSDLYKQKSLFCIDNNGRLVMIAGLAQTQYEVTGLAEWNNEIKNTFSIDKETIVIDDLIHYKPINTNK